MGEKGRLLSEIINLKRLSCKSTLSFLLLDKYLIGSGVAQGIFSPIKRKKVIFLKKKMTFSSLRLCLYILSGT